MPAGRTASGESEGGLRAKVQVIYTGGTIGSIHRDPNDPLSPLEPGKWAQIRSLPAVSAAITDLDKVDRIGISYEEFDPTLDSSNMSPSNWIQIAEIIEKHYNSFDGFVILHGTDTMTYTAAALSFMLQNLSKPVIITGSQLPIELARTDAVQNFITAIKIAAGPHLQPPLPLVPEVCIFFQEKLIRGNRSRKINASGYDAFDSPNYPLLGEAGEYIVVKRESLRPPPISGARFSLNRNLEQHVMSLDIFPGIQSTDVMKKIMETEGLKGLVLKTYGTGNAPSDASFLDAIGAGVKKGVVVVDVTQCLRGKVEIGLYGTSEGLLTRGVVTGTDMTPEAALCKMMFLLRRGAQARELVQQDIAGEQSESLYTIDFQDTGIPNTAGPEYIGPFKSVQGLSNTTDLTNAVIRLTNIKFDGPEGSQFRVSAFLGLDQSVPTSFDEQEKMAEYCEYKEATWENKPITLAFEGTNAAKGKLTNPSIPINVAIHVDKGSISWEKLTLTVVTSAGKMVNR